MGQAAKSQEPEAMTKREKLMMKPKNKILAAAGVEITEQDELIFSALRKMLHNGGRWMREDDMGYNLPTFICCRNEKRLCPQELRLACEFWPSAGGIIFDRKEDAEKAIASFSAEEHEALVESFLKA